MAWLISVSAILLGVVGSFGLKGRWYGGWGVVLAEWLFGKVKKELWCFCCGVFLVWGLWGGGGILRQWIDK